LTPIVFLALTVRVVCSARRVSPTSYDQAIDTSDCSLKATEAST